MKKKFATGTDAVALACAQGSSPQRYAGKHVLFGEMLACLGRRALGTSSRWLMRVLK